MADTGTGATISLSTTAVGQVRSLTMPEFSVEDVQTSHLGTTNYHTYVAADLTEPGEITAEILFNATSDSVPARGTAEVATITWPIHTSGNTTNATFVADGYVKSFKIPDFTIGELQVATLVFKLNGEDTEPAFTAESA